MLRHCIARLGTAVCHARPYHTTTALYRKVYSKRSAKIPREPMRLDENVTSGKKEEEEEMEYSSMKQPYVTDVPGYHRIMVIQPYVKWGPKKRMNTTPQLMLQEAVSLAETMTNWAVVQKLVVPMTSLGRQAVFGSGTMESLKDCAKRAQITALFVSMNMLTGPQYNELKSHFKVPIYDRYTVVLQIFQDHAKTKEAKMQIQLAEIPYLKARIVSEISEKSHSWTTGGYQLGGGENQLEAKKQILRNRENRIKKSLNELRKHRQLVRRQRTELDFPVVAVVGYTNAGKTSLIKAVTGTSKLTPEDRLFATLDVTNHMCSLPHNIKALMVDTVGFVSDIPTDLVEAFVATLEDALLAEVIVHVFDVSHPDVRQQIDTVNETLAALPLDDKIRDNVILVGNKTDLISETELNEKGFDKKTLLVSSTKGTGISTLSWTVEAAIIEATGRKIQRLRLPNGGPELQWLRKEAAVFRVVPDPSNSQAVIVSVILTKAVHSRFQHSFFGKQVHDF